jgi:hypothetical protein
MDTADSQPLRSHLADFETTTSHFLQAADALAILNFAALFHEEIFLTDTALGDHQLIIDSFFKDKSRPGLFSQISGLARAGILRFMYRNKVVVRDKLLYTSPTISQIYEGWLLRDKLHWAGEKGFTSTVAEPYDRHAYYRELENLSESRSDIIYPYDPDIPRESFRHKVREQLEGVTMLSESLSRLPVELRRKYIKATKDPWFTNAELWRVLRQVPNGIEPIILHAHVNQQCFAHITGAGQSEHDRTAKSLASFNLELQYRKPFALELDATLEPPQNLEDLLGRARVQLAPGIEMFSQLSVDQIIRLRRRASGIFELARRRIQVPEELAALRDDYLKAITRYWNYIINEFELLYPAKMIQSSRAGLFLEEKLPPLSWISKKFGKSIVTMLLRFQVGAAAPVVSEAVHRLGFVFLQERTSVNEQLRGQGPFFEQYPQWCPRGILGLDGMRVKRDER